MKVAVVFHFGTWTTFDVVSTSAKVSHYVSAIAFFVVGVDAEARLTIQAILAHGGPATSFGFTRIFCGASIRQAVVPRAVDIHVCARSHCCCTPGCIMEIGRCTLIVCDTLVHEWKDARIASFSNNATAADSVFWCRARAGCGGR